MLYSLTMVYTWCYTAPHYTRTNQAAISGQQNGKLSTETMSPNSYSQKNNNELLFAHQPQFNKGKKVCVFIRAAKQRFENISQSQRRPLYRDGDRTSEDGARTAILKTIHIDPCQESTKGVKQFHGSFHNTQRKRLPAPSPC